MSQHEEFDEDEGMDEGMDEGGAGQASPFVVSAGAVLLTADSPLLWAPLLDRPLLAWTVATFEATPCIQAIALPIAVERLAHTQALGTAAGWRKTQVLTAEGEGHAALRTGLQALLALDPTLRLVAVHEGARPLVTPELIAAGIHAAQRTGVAVAAEPVNETIKRVRDGLIAQTMPRERLVRAQMPVIFLSALLRSALLAAPETALPPTDVTAFAMTSGLPVRMFPGSPENVKVTSPDDLAVAESLLARRLGAS